MLSKKEREARWKTERDANIIVVTVVSGFSLLIWVARVVIPIWIAVKVLQYMGVL